MGSFLSILDPLRDGLYHLLVAFQGALAPLVGSHSAWLAIVALTVTVRVMLLPLALAQWRATRAMQALAPEVRELRRQHADDPRRLRSELAKLYANHNADRSPAACPSCCRPLSWSRCFVCSPRPGWLAGRTSC